jgi:hypothetical protein
MVGYGMGWDLTPALLGKEREVCGWSEWLVFRDGKSVPSTNNLSPLLSKERARVRF